ncbi:MAG: hypothetical protein AAFV88_15565 [Planctomycetota bacterium]
MSSSNRQASAVDGLVSRGPQPVGPMRLPPVDSCVFVEQFNRIYKAIDLQLESNEKSVESVSPDTHDGSTDGLPSGESSSALE